MCIRDSIRMKVLDLFSGTYACGDSLNPDISVPCTASTRVTPRRVATMTAYDSIERGAADECEPLRGRRSRTFTLTQLLVACGVVCVCAIAATKAVNTHRAPEGVCDDRARAHADYVFLHEQLTTCGNKLAECAARCPLEGAARLSATEPHD